MSLNGWPSAPVPHPSLVFKTDGNALGVGVQALMLGKIGNAGLNFAQGIAGVINETGLFHKIVHAQRAGKTCRAAGGQGVVGAGKIIAQRFRHILAQENAARVLYAVQNGERVVHTNFQMLRGNDVHGVNGLVHIVRHNDLAVGVREGVEEDTNKRNKNDFVLWFTKSKFENQALKWDSPWCIGYPGWHIECSGIYMKYNGEYLDLHCGGVDNAFPHHTNEIAQSESYLGHAWCPQWFHVHHLNTSTGKMSKSKGEFLTVYLL